MVSAIDTSYNFLQQHSSIDVSFAMIEIGNLDSYRQAYGENVANGIIGTLGSIIKKCLRSEDVMGYMGNGIIGMVLLDCNTDSAKSVFGRMKSKVDGAKINMKNGQAVTLPMLISYTQIRKDRKCSPMLIACEDGLARLAQRGREGIVLV